MILCVVDDDAVFRLSTQLLLSTLDLDYKYIEFENGLEAITYIKEASSDEEKLPSHLFLDLNMPVLDGWGFLESYLPMRDSLAKPIEIHIVTSSIDDDDRLKAEKIPVVEGYIIKPVDREELLRVIGSLN